MNIGKEWNHVLIFHARNMIVSGKMNTTQSLLLVINVTSKGGRGGGGGRGRHMLIGRQEQEFHHSFNRGKTHREGGQLVIYTVQ